MSAYYNENDPEKAAWLRELIRQNVVAPGEVDERSIAEVGASDLRGFAQCHFFAGIGVWSYSLRLAGWPDDRPVWTGSCPCPSFSAAGKGSGFDDPRHLWPAWYRLVPECCPPTIFGEQADDAIGYGWIDLVQTDLERANYAVGKAVLTAAGVGAPHARERLYFVAHAERPEVLARREVLSRSGTDRADRPRDSRADVRMGHADSERCGKAGSAEPRRRRTGGERASRELDNANGPRRDGARQGTESEARDDARLCGPESGRSAGSLDDALSNGRRTRREDDAGDVRLIPRATLSNDDVADSDRRGQSVCGQSSEGQRDVEQRNETLRLGEPNRKRLEGLSGDGQDGHQSRWFGEKPNGATGPAGFVNGFWRDADWVLRNRWNSDDWEWCPTEPGTFPLVTGATNRVLKLRGYGDAIVPQVAAAFIEASLEAERLTL